MSTELAQLLGVGIALAGLMLGLQVRADKRRDARDARMDKRLDGMDRRLDGMDKLIGSLQSEVRGIDRRLARIEGLIEGSGLFRPADAPASAGD